jgi:outer membrane protein assembly factor BamB
MFYFTSSFLLLFAILFTSLPMAASANQSTEFPDIIPLPNGFQPEGVVIGGGTTIFAGSLADGSIYQANLRTGKGDILVEGQDGLIAVGLGYDKRSNNLFVAGGPGGDARVYDAASGELLMTYQLAAPGATFINDVIITRQAAYFTDSFNPFFYRVPLHANGRLPDPTSVEEIALGDDFVFIPGGFNANGIEASADGRTLIIVNSGTGTLYRVDPNSGEASPIDLGGDVVTSGDGLVRQGHTLYVVRNFLNQVAVVELSSDLASGAIVDTITNDAFRIPTTADIFGTHLYAVNARFDVQSPTPDTEYEIVRVHR